MNVLLVTALVAGGVGRHVEMLVRGLGEQGHRVVVACPEQVSGRFDMGTATVDLALGARPRPARDAAAVGTLRSLLPGADVVHAHGLRAGALAVLARGRHRDPRLVVTTHNAPPEGRLAGALYGGMERLVARRADLVLGVSPDLLDRAGRAGAERAALAVVPAVAGSRVDHDRARAALDAELDLPAGTQVVLVVGRLATQKGLDLAVSAHAALLAGLGRGRTPVPGAHLVLVGDGPERTGLERVAGRAGSRVHLLGHRDDVPSLLAAADVVLSTARWEGQPVWLQEALQQGAAIVATDVGGTASVVGDAALLVPPPLDGATPPAGLREDVASALARVLTDATVRNDLRARALARAAELPTEADAVEAALTAYRGTL